MSTAALLCMTAFTAMAPAVAKDGDAGKKIGPALERVYQQNAVAKAKGKSAATTSGAAKLRLKGAKEDRPASDAFDSNTLFLGNISNDGYVRIDAVAANLTTDLEVTMKSMGARKVATRGRTVSAEFPADRLMELNANQYLAFARPALATTNVGLVTSQGDRSMRTDIVRNNSGFSGKGLTIGVLSDSFACDPGTLAGGPYTTPAEDVANGDLPANVTILKDFLDQSSCIDEGRGMAQLIHDVLPDAAIAFYTAFDGEADFANGILQLAKAGADVIVDDVIYFAEPMFQDGIIAQAADEAARLGIPYYSSNGNRARDAFQDKFRAVNTPDGVFHDFDPGPGVDYLNTITLDGSLQTNLVLNWDSPNFSVSGAPGAQNDVDVVMFDQAGVRVADCFPGGGPFVPPANGLCQFQFTDGGGLPIDGGAGGDAIELVSLVDLIGGSTVQIGLESQSGAAPGFVKFVLFGGGITAAEYAINAPSGYGHNNADGAEGVGAAAFYFTEEFIGDPNTLQLRAQAGEPECVPACLNDFSSAGGTPIFFDTAGNRLRRPVVRPKPGITAPDGGNTSFFFSDTSRDDDDGDGVFQSGEPGEFPNFFGTSAAAPHAAAVAAMMIDAENSEVIKNGAFRMCQPKRRQGNTKNLRKNGRNLSVPAAEVDARIAQGALLGPCSRTEPAEIYKVMRKTAQNMTVRADNGTGATLQTFTELGNGFDFDSGFGMVDAEKALRKFRSSTLGNGHGRDD
ncbi:MAG: hypothetical protein AB7F91_14670 [Parvularculaceae bacterium]